ncbi:MarR family transcriptional regulator, partial [candidate division WOR-3 bacterium]|nr:MarR family transcriptional regulator [candidate division WOR-3 bacterium]
GPSAIASRTKRFLDILVKDGEMVYRNQGIQFKTKWFPVFYALYKSDGPLSITDISNSLHFTHPNVIKIVRSMAKKGMVISLKDEYDARKHLIKLSDKGRTLIPVLEPLWKAFENAVLELFDEVDCDFIEALLKMEKSLQKKGMAERVISNIKKIQYDAVAIIEYTSELKKYFRDFNYEWLAKFFEIEKYDEEILNNPEKYILSKNGFILFALINGEIVGTCAVSEISKDEYELSKLAVTEKKQNRQAGKKLVAEAIKKVKERNGKIIFLLTDEKLTRAIKLYKSLGFSVEKKRKFHGEELSRSKTSTTMSLTLN